MAGVTQFFENEGYEMFKNAVYQSKEASKNDPEDEPYKSMYAAREIFMNLKTCISDFQNEDTQNKDLKLAIACLDLHIGCNFAETSETSAGEEYLSKVFQSIEDIKMDEKAISIYLLALNHMGILWSARNRYDKAKSYLDQAEQLFQEFKSNVGDAPYRADEFFTKPEEDEAVRLSRRAKKFESIFTHTLYYKAQVLAKVGEDQESATYCHITLHRQLDSHDYDPVDWALNAATLSQVYITQEKFPLARHCLACASVIFQETRPFEEASEEVNESWRLKDADIKRCWIKYGLQLLDVSQDTMMQNVDTFDQDHGLDSDGKVKAANSENKNSGAGKADHNYDKASNQLKEEKDNDDEKLDGKHKFEPFNLEVTAYEEKVADMLVRTFDEARQVFLFVQDLISTAKEVYTLDSHCSDFIELTQDHSRAFKLLAFFELDMERQCRMHKRRINMLLELLNQLSMQHYLLVCRQLMFEAAETYSTMLDIKLSMLELEVSQPSPHAAQKINSLVHHSIQQYQAYLDTLKGGKPDLPDRFPEGNDRPALIATFCCGRLWGKILTGEVSERLSYMKKSMECYKFVVDYCHRHPAVKVEVEKERALCEELVALMPLKMAKIQEQGAV